MISPFRCSTFRGTFPLEWAEPTRYPWNLLGVPCIKSAKPNPETIERSFAALLFRRFDPDECAGVFSGEDVEQAIGTLAYVANALFEIAQHTFAV